MRYYIVINEWNYPTESGREIIGDFDTREKAVEAAKAQYEKERKNFLKTTNGVIYEPSSGVVTTETELLCIGYMLNSSVWDEDNIFFHSIIIERDTFKWWHSEENPEDTIIQIHS